MVIHVFVLSSLYFYNSHKLPVRFHFSSLFTNLNTHPTSHSYTAHSPPVTTIPLLAVVPSSCTAVALSLSLTSHCSNHFFQVLPLVASTDPWILYVFWTCVPDSSIWVSLLFAVTLCLEVEFCDYFQVGVLKLVKDWVLGFDFLFFFFLCLSIGMLGQII